MPAQPFSVVENNFTKGLITEFTGLNFPEHAATECDNCIFDITGEVSRRLGIDFEDGFNEYFTPTALSAINTYKWGNAGGDGSTQLLVVQTGLTLSFYRYSDTTPGKPISQTKLNGTISLTPFIAAGNTEPSAQNEAVFTDGNGYLFVFHPNCDPFYVTYSSGILTAAVITMKIRDLIGVSEPGVPVDQRPTTLSDSHLYNIYNQGWTSSPDWLVGSNSSALYKVGADNVFDVGTSTLPITPGDVINITWMDPVYGYPIMGGVVTAYTGNNVHVHITAVTAPYLNGASWNIWQLAPSNNGHIDVWHTANNNYPSNGDVWWNYKNSSGQFDPATTASNVTVNLGPAPKGHFILDVFNQQRGIAAAVSNITPIVTSHRPSTGTWFQGRVWYAGVNAVQPAAGTALQYSWTETIYFSQIVQTTDDFGKCFQTNDPTSETLFGILPTDGGTVTIQGCGQIYKLFPIQNGLLVFAANGVWFITGSQGIGFTATDYTITKISSVQSISGTSFVNVLGLPYFWNTEGIYSVQPSQQGGLTVDTITVGTILSFFNEIPKASRKYARGDYNAIDYVIQWVYKSTNETNVTSRYQFDRMLNYNTYNKAFYPYSVSSITEGEIQPHISAVNYLVSANPAIAPDPVFKYLVTYSTTVDKITFAEEYDDNYVDWATVNAGSVTEYESYFITGYKLVGQAQHKFQVNYIVIYSDAEEPTGYKIQGIWDFATSGNSGRTTNFQTVTNGNSRFGILTRRHRIRGSGLVLQIKVKSQDGLPFNIIGWSTQGQSNAGM